MRSRRKRQTLSTNQPGSRIGRTKAPRNLIGWSDWEVILTVPESLLGKNDLEMTLIDVAYRYGAQPTENQVRALSSAGAVYGIRHIAFNEKERTLRVEYDASHMSESAVAGLLRDAGIDLREKLVLT